jgi:hypothetical protein
MLSWGMSQRLLTPSLRRINLPPLRLASLNAHSREWPQLTGDSPEINNQVGTESRPRYPLGTSHSYRQILRMMMDYKFDQALSG